MLKRDLSPRVNLRNLTENPLALSWTEKDEWVADLLQEQIPQLLPDGSPVTFQATLTREGSNILLHGQMHLKLRPTCDRCAKEFDNDCRENFHLILMPAIAPVRPANPKKEKAKKSRERDKAKAAATEDDAEWEETEDLTDLEDVNSSILTSDEVDLSTYFREQVLLAIPMTQTCRPDCPGLCLRCGKDLSLGPCNCKDQVTDDRWQALKELKLRS